MIVIIALFLAGFAPTAQGVPGPGAAASDVAAATAPGAAVAAKKKTKKPQATLTYTAAVDAAGRLAVHFASNSTKVIVRYKLGKKKKSKTLKVRAGTVNYVLPAKAKSASAQAKATKKLRASARLALAATPAPPPPTPTPAPPVGPVASVTLTGAPTRSLLYQAISVSATIASPAAGTASLQQLTGAGWTDVATQGAAPGNVTLSTTPAEPGDVHLRITFTPTGGAAAASAEAIVVVPAAGFTGTLAPGTIQVPAGAITSVSGNPKISQTLVLNQPVAGLAVGSVVVAGLSANSPDGLLGQVASVTPSGSGVRLVTTPASMDQAYSDYTIAVGGTLADVAPAGVRALSKAGLTDQADQLRDAALSGLEMTCSSGLSLHNIDFDLGQIESDIYIRFSGTSNPVRSFKLFINPNLTFDLGIDASADCHLAFTALRVPIGSTGLFITLRPFIYVGVSGNVGATLTVSSRAGFSWDGSAHPGVSVRPSLQLTRGASAGAEAKLGADLTLSFAEQAGIRGHAAAVLGVGTWLENGSACYKVTAELEAGVTAFAKLWLLGEKDFDLISERRFLTQDLGGRCTARSGTTTTVPGSGAPPSTGTPAGTPSGGKTFTIVGAGSGAVARSGPYLASGATRTVPNGTQVTVNCQVAGDAVPYGGRPSVVWNSTSSGDYIPDVYFNTPTAWDFSSSVLPRCAGTPPPPGSVGTGTTGNYQVVNTGGIGLRFHTGAAMGAAVTRVLPEGARVNVICQVAGESVTAFGRPSIVWNKTEQGDYATDVYFNTPGAWDFSATLPRCGGSPPIPPPTGTPSVAIERGAARTGGWYIRFNVSNGRANAKVGCQFSTSDGKYNGQWQRNVQLDGAGNGSSAPQEGTGTTWIWGFSGTISGNCDGIAFSRGF